MKKEKKIKLHENWGCLCDKIQALFNNEVDHIFIKTNSSTILMFHSNKDGSVNKRKIKYFEKLYNEGKVNKFLCCDPDKIPLQYRKFHLLSNFVGEIKTVPEKSYAIDDDNCVIVLAEK